MNYDQNYYLTSCGNISYNDEEFKIFFENVADKIINTLHPTTVLDVGCAFGYLVTALRDKGVNAYGIDISEYAIGQVREDIKPYCRVCSGLEPLPSDFPERYDLVTNIEVIEHLYEEDGLEFMKRLCHYSDKVLFSSTPDDITEKTHFNVQQHEYWAKHFAENAFLKDLLYDASYISPNSFLFTKESKPMVRMVEDYERSLRITKNISNNIIEQKDAEIRSLIDQKDREISAIIDKKNEEIEGIKRSCQQELERKHCEVAQWEASYYAINNSTSWKMTRPLRRVVSSFKRVLRTGRITRKFYKGLAYLKYHGLRATYRKVVKNTVEENVFKKYYKTHIRNIKKLEDEKSTKFNKKIKISILVPLYNTPKSYLIEMIQSVQKQTYGNWELCLADGSDEKHLYVEKICKKLSQRDARIKYKKLEKNQGISENTNRCIDMSTGDYIGLLDHDDILNPSALYEVMRAICEKDADFIYTDEATFEGKKVDNITSIHFKPDYAIDNLRANNYICHFTCFNKKLLDKAGVFRSEYDGSQDHDFVLRLTHIAERVVHIPMVLYYWRSHKNSVAFDINSKSYAIDAGKRAVLYNIRQNGLDAIVESSKVFPTIYRIRYKLLEKPLISIIIPNKDHIDDLKVCIDSIVNKSTYNQYEIIIVENNSALKETFDYYHVLEKKSNIKVVKWGGAFNYSAINNYAVQYANGEYLLFLNNDVEIINSDWLEEMLMYAQRSDVGAVGAKLYYPDDTIQHAGIGIGLLGLAAHYHRNVPTSNPGYMGRLSYAQDVSAVTGACLMMRKDVFEKIKGFDESFEVAFNDVDLCMRIRQKGYLIAFTPYAELYHYESKSRGNDDVPEKKKRFDGEVLRFQKRWEKELKAGDPYYNPNLSLDSEVFEIKEKR